MRTMNDGTDDPILTKWRTHERQRDESHPYPLHFMQPEVSSRVSGICVADWLDVD